MLRLFVASFTTLSLMLGMAAGVVITAMVASDQLNLTAAIAIVVAFNLVLWLLSPWLTDLSLSWLNSMEFLDDAELARRHPHVHKLIHEVADEYRFKAPSVGIIKDRNPTAFTYGRGRGSARIVLTEGMFEYLSAEETRAVVAHELGHIVHRDFIVMTLAGVLVQILYQVYVVCTRLKGDSKNKLAIIGFVALLFYWLGEYLLLYLSRTREYLADEFAGRRAEPRHLASALVKVAYGISQADDTEATTHLLKSTRHMGLIDPKNARATGVLAGGADVMERPATEATAAPAPAPAPAAKPVAIPAEAMLFDVYNPWAKLSELSSTHPLTGKRIQALAALSREHGQRFEIDIEAAAVRAGLDRGSLWGRFLWQALVYYSPLMLAIALVLAGYWPLAPAAFALAVLMTLLLRFPPTTPRQATIMELMSDPRASPVFGMPIHLQGTPIGRTDAGSILGEDVMLRDKSGLIAVDFRSMAGVIGDLIAGLLRVKQHIGQPGEVRGWFRRDMLGHVVLREMRTTAGRLGCVPWFWQAVMSLVAIAITIAALVRLGPGFAYQPIPYSEIGKLLLGR